MVQSFEFSHPSCPSQLITLASSLSLCIPLSANGPIMLYGKWLVGLCSCKVPVKYCSTRPMTQIFQQMIFPRVSWLSIPDYPFRAHDKEPELQFHPHWSLGSTSFPSASTPGLCQPENQRDISVFEWCDFCLTPFLKDQGFITEKGVWW